MKTKIEAEIDVPDGFEFDRIDRIVNNGIDYDVNGGPFTTTSYTVDQIILRKKEQQASWARMYKSRSGRIKMVASVDKEIRGEITSRIGNDFIEWVGDWKEYTDANMSEREDSGTSLLFMIAASAAFVACFVFIVYKILGW